MLYATSQRRQFTREIADRLRRGLGSLSLVAAPSALGVWSLGPLLAAECLDHVLMPRVVQIDASTTDSVVLAGPDPRGRPSILETCVTQVFERLRFDAELDGVRDELDRLRQGVRNADQAESQIVLTSRFASVLARVRPVVVVLSNLGDTSEPTVAQLRRAASYLAGVPCAVIVLLPAGTQVGNSVPPLFTASIPQLDPDDAHNLLSAVTAAHVDPMTAALVAESCGGRIEDVRENGAALSAAALGGRELLPYEPVVSASTRAMVAEEVGLLAPDELEALVASQLQLVQDDDVVERVTGARPVRVVEGLVPAPDAAFNPPPRSVPSRAVIDSVDEAARADLHLRLAQAYPEGTREHAWHLIGAGRGRTEDADTLLDATAAELDHGSLLLARRLTEVFRDVPGGTTAQRSRARLLEASLALHLGAGLTASTTYLEVTELDELVPEHEIEAITGYVCARGGEEMSAQEDRRMVERLVALAPGHPAPVARCLIMMAAQEMLVGDEVGPASHLGRASEIIEAAGCESLAGCASLVDELVRREPWSLTDTLMEVPEATPRSDIGVWAELIIRAYLAITGEAGQRNTVAIEAMLGRLSGVSPLIAAHVSALHALLAERRGWTGAAREQLEADRARVPMRVGLNGVGVALAAQAAMLFGDDLTFRAWREAMTASGSGGWSSPRQLWASVLEAVSRLVDGDVSLASLVLGPAVSAPVPHAYLMAVWSSVVDMVVLEPSLTDRVPGLAAWLRQGAPEPRGGSLDDRVIEVLLVDDDEAVAVISRLVLDAVVAGSIIWQVRANMACAARLRRSPELDVATLGISSDAVSSASVLLERARELAASHGMEFWVAAARRLEPEPEPAPPAPVARAPSSPNLTDTALQVARLAAQGWRNKEIAGELYMAVRTVELRLTGVYRALGISSRKDLAQALADAHLMED